MPFRIINSIIFVFLYCIETKTASGNKTRPFQGTMISSTQYIDVNANCHICSDPKTRGMISNPRLLSHFLWLEKVTTFFSTLKFNYDSNSVEFINRTENKKDYKIVGGIKIEWIGIAFAPYILVRYVPSDRIKNSSVIQ